MYKVFICLAACALLWSCSNQKFKVEGRIDGAAGETLYLEHNGILRTTPLDSVKVAKDGSYSLKAVRPEYPDFYRLRIKNKTITFAIDSTETVSVRADYPTMATAYEVDGSAECARIKELALMQNDLQRRVTALGRDAALTPAEARDSLEAMLAAHKDRVARDYIFKDPKAASSYFALFQAIGSYLIFDPGGAGGDIKAFAAVATAWDTFYPGSLRGENLHNIAIRGMKTERIMQTESQAAIDPAKVTTTGLIDITLNDNQGRPRSLSQLKGKVVMLDFHLYGMDDSPQRILSLRELYGKYHSRGFEIYQVSIDPDEHFWKQQTAALPWICVRDPQGAASPRVSVYNVSSVPEFFLIDRDNNVVSRSTQIDDLDAAIDALL